MRARALSDALGGGLPSDDEATHAAAVAAWRVQSEAMLAYRTHGIRVDIGPRLSGRVVGLQRDFVTVDAARHLVADATMTKAVPLEVEGRVARVVKLHPCRRLHVVHQARKRTDVADEHPRRAVVGARQSCRIDRPHKYTVARAAHETCAHRERVGLSTRAIEHETTRPTRVSNAEGPGFGCI